MPKTLTVQWGKTMPILPHTRARLSQKSDTLSAPAILFNSNPNLVN
jgi:hypothetical protein